VSIFSSLTNRIFFATAFLAVFSIGVAMYRVNTVVTAQAEQELHRGLEEAATRVENYRATLVEHLQREARLIADLPRLKAAVYENDPPTVEPLAAEYRRQLDADLFVVTGRGNTSLAGLGAPEIAAGRAAEQAALAIAAGGRETVSFWPTAGGAIEVVSVPVWIDSGQPEILGTLHVGFLLDDRAAARLKTLTESEVGFAFDGTIQAATLPRDHWGRLAPLATADQSIRLDLGGEEYVAVSRPLTPVTAAVEASALQPALIVLRSRTERLRVLSDLHAALAVTGLAAVLAAIGLSYALARTVTRPLGAITTAMRDIAGSGDLTRRIPEPPATRWDDEDARLLARTFNTMTSSIARFQREAAQRERLSSLGRLSTVIAHEIRNPLMIIKSALRPLRKEPLAADQVRRAAGDIEEEVARLNRIVSEVLDFARPIRLDLALADVNAVCDAAVRAVCAGESHPRVAVELDASLPRCLVDADRLRQALVNVLSNARHAALTHQGDGARVTLRTSRGEGHVRIVVSDNGPGIPSDALPRMFEPFFTTTPAGSGIGLAITRNIIEGLEGSVAVARSDSNGTDIQIELPLPASAAAPRVIRG
jgi:signal transduction histidine kinase